MLAKDTETPNAATREVDQARALKTGWQLSVNRPSLPSPKKEQFRTCNLRKKRTCHQKTVNLVKNNGCLLFRGLAYVVDYIRLNVKGLPRKECLGEKSKLPMHHSFNAFPFGKILGRLLHFAQLTLCIYEMQLFALVKRHSWQGGRPVWTNSL